MATRRHHTRRQALRLIGGGVIGAGLTACGFGDDNAAAPAPATPAAPVAPTATLPPVARATSTPSPSPTPAPTPRPVPPLARIEHTMMAETKWATPLVVSHSGVEGPRVMVLGGVHGNEPGGWRAAEQIAQWQPAAGSLLTIPRANVLATYEFERTLPGSATSTASTPAAARCCR